MIACLWFYPLLLGEQLGQSYSLFTQPPWQAAAPAEPLPARGVFPDIALGHHPWAAVARDQLQDGHLPLWNPYEYGGMSLLGNMQSALFFPLSWLLFLLPLNTAWGIVALLKTLLAGLGAWALARELGAGRYGALLAGTVFMLSAPFTFLLQWPLATVFALLPWLLLATAWAARSPGPGPVAAVATAFGLSILAGHPESALIAVSAAGVFFIGLLAFGRERPGRPLATWLGGLVLGTAIGAVAVIPFVQALWPSITRIEHGAVADAFSLPWSSLLQFGVPGIFGNGEPDVYGYPQYLYVSGYFGLPALVLAALALVWRRREAGVLALAATAAVGLLAAYGVPPVSWFLELVPPWSDSIFGERVYSVLALAGAVGAGLGLSSLELRPLALWRVPVVVAAAAAAVGAALLAAQLAGVLEAPGSVKRESVAVTVALLLAAGALIAAAGRLPPWATGAGALALAVLSLAGLQNLNVMLPAEQAYPATPPSIEVLQREARRAPFRLGLIRRPGLSLPLLPNTGAPYRIEGIEGYDFPLSERWSDFQTAVLGFRRGKPEARSFRGAPTRSELAALRMMNTRYWLAPPDTPPPVRAFRPVYEGPDATVFYDPQALPRAYVVPRALERSEPRTLAALAAGDLDARRTALVPPGTAPAPRPATVGLQRARVSQLAPDHVRVRIPAGAGGGWLVLANAHSPFWDAEVDGRPVDIQPTNHAAMGVPVEVGTRTVDFRLDRTGFWAGAGISALALLLTGALALAGLGQARRGPRQTAITSSASSSPSPRSSKSPTVTASASGSGVLRSRRRRQS